MRTPSNSRIKSNLRENLNISQRRCIFLGIWWFS
jgi:hypothetical protein